MIIKEESEDLIAIPNANEVKSYSFPIESLKSPNSKRLSSQILLTYVGLFWCGYYKHS